MAVSIGGFVKEAIKSIGVRSDRLEVELDKLLATDSVSPEDMLMVNYELGQYNSMLEVTSSINKSLCDVLKSLAQRTG